jgi:hypothetical protein
VDAWIIVQNLEVTLYLIKNFVYILYIAAFEDVLSHSRIGFTQFGYCLDPIIFLYSEILRCMFFG